MASSAAAASDDEPGSRGESLIRYTEEVVLPRIDASLAELDHEDRLKARPAEATVLPPP